MAAGHLVAGLNAALNGQVNLDHLEHARSEIVAGGNLRLLVFEALFELALLRGETLGDLL